MFYKISALIILQLLMSVVVYAFSVYNAQIDLMCNTWGNISSIRGETTLKNNFYLRLFPNGEGVIGLEGHMLIQGQSVPVRKEISVKYRRIDQDTFQFTKFEMTSTEKDKVPDEILERYFFPVGSRGVQIFTLSKIANAWIVGGRFTPAFVCAAH